MSLILLSYLYTLPSATTALSTMGETSDAWFTEFVPMMLMILAIYFAVIIIMFIMQSVLEAFGLMTTKQQKNQTFGFKGED